MMPSYAYKCHTCGENFRLFKPVEDKDNHVSCGCGSNDVIRTTKTYSDKVPGNHTIVVKGAGFCGVSIAGQKGFKKRLAPGEVNMDDTLY